MPSTSQGPTSVISFDSYNDTPLVLLVILYHQLILKHYLILLLFLHLALLCLIFLIFLLIIFLISLKTHMFILMIRHSLVITVFILFPTIIFFLLDIPQEFLNYIITFILFCLQRILILNLFLFKLMFQLFLNHILMVKPVFILNGEKQCQ